MPLLTIGDITSIYNELRNTHLRMLNKERAEMVAEAWADGRPIPTPAQVLPHHKKKRYTVILLKRNLLTIFECLRKSESPMTVWLLI